MAYRLTAIEPARPLHYAAPIPRSPAAGFARLPALPSTATATRAEEPNQDRATRLPAISTPPKAMRSRAMDRYAHWPARARQEPCCGPAADARCDTPAPRPATSANLSVAEAEIAAATSTPRRSLEAERPNRPRPWAAGQGSPERGSKVRRRDASAAGERAQWL